MTRRNIAEQLFNDALNTIKESQGELEKTISGYTSGVSGRPLVDVIEDYNNIIVITDLPGFKKEDIKLDISEATLEITANFQEDILEEGYSYIKKERKYGEINRKIELPVRIKIDESQADFENGILKVTMPKKEIEENLQIIID
ncbi:MAG: Hsp20/alpha crystallin family protein [Methanobacterium sp.]|nr:Hsp20/alpha crystallin family protein [Methanobacterium sp.]